MIVKFMCATVCVLLSVVCVAQHTITGSVSEIKKNQSLAGASVHLVESNLFTTTDEMGHFSFNNVKPGEYAVKVTYMGYADHVEIITVNGDVNTVFSLRESSIITDAVVVNATRATDKTPTTFTTITKESIQKQNFGQDLPFLINWTPSVVTTSDAGTGVGYTGIRIRGSDATRINVTINGIPYNDAESMGTFWVDIPDIASSSQSIQIQRGVGTSTNGAAAFGATINLQTNLRQDNPYAEVVNSFGSFNTRRHTLNFGSGLLNNHWVIEGRLSKIASDGFIDRATADLNSYYLSAAFYAGNTMLKGIFFGGRERTYQSWYGVPESRLKNDIEAMEATALNEGWNENQIQNLLTSNSRTFNPYQYKNQVDNYGQDNYQLHFSQKLNDAFTLTSALHYTPGKGYYEEYRHAQDFEDYGISPIMIGDSTVESSDLIRRRWLDNHFYGFTYSFNYDKNNWNLVLGGGWNRYTGDHFGEIIWAEVSPVPTEHRYYFNSGDKRDFNTYLKANYQLSVNINAFLDLQYRGVTFNAAGIENTQNTIRTDETFNFFNPKAGLTYSITNNQQLYASFSIANREPVRDDFVDNPGKTPKHESLQNLEIGYRRTTLQHVLHVNYYLMNYKNQLVLTGQLNDVGASVRTNVAKSYRSGMEIESLLKLTKKLQWNANLTLSQNKIAEFKEVLYDYGTNFDEYNLVERTHKNSNISFSPNVIAGSQLLYAPVDGAEIGLLTKYVGKQYLDNTSNNHRSFDNYLVNDIRLRYVWKPSFMKEISISLLMNNILNEAYESNGYTWGYLAGTTEARENYYYPQAGRNFMAMISLKF
jgi:iron complex outermembrane receptor protein